MRQFCCRKTLPSQGMSVILMCTYYEKYHRKIQEQNALAMSLLDLILKDPFIKTVIHKFGSALMKRILKPLIERVEPVDELKNLDERSTKTVAYLMLHHADKGRQYDGLRMETRWENLYTKKGILSVLY